MKDTNQFKSIDSLYNYIDENSFELKRNFELTDIWVRYRNQTELETEKIKSQWEIDCFLFDLKSDILFSQIYSHGKNISEITKYPDLNEFKTKVVEYIKLRITSSKSPLLKARYNHLLWKCPSGIKQTKYAIGAIENYIISIKEYYNRFKETENRENSFQICQLYEVLVAISNEIKFDMAELKKLTRFLLFETDNLEFYIIHSILSDMLKYRKIFKTIDFNNTLSFFEEQLNTETKLDDLTLGHEYLSTAIKISKKLGEDHRIWHNEKGLAYLRLAETITNPEQYWVKQDYHAKAIEEFKLANNTTNRKTSEKLYADLKPLIKLNTFSIPYTKEIEEAFNKHDKNLRNKAQNLLKLESSKVYRFISMGDFFPNYEITLEASKKSNKFLNYLTTISFDKNKNIIKDKVENKELKNVYKAYEHQLHTTVLPQLHYTIIHGIESGNLTFKNFINFLEQETWIGKTHIRYDLGGNEQHINWIEQLSPSIVEFFIQTQAWCISKYYKPSFILCIDSFTLKMEGIFRSFCEIAKIPISTYQEKGMQEIYINNVFDNEIIIKYFNEDDRLFFNYLFSNDGGLNLRNNIAHCFYTTKDYHPNKMLLLISALLRLGKYNYIEKTSS
ncbi:DUF4209 domain-containing protein [Wenyingzhuangia sp. IMCC45574]